MEPLTAVLATALLARVSAGVMPSPSLMAPPVSVRVAGEYTRVYGSAGIIVFTKADMKSMGATGVFKRSHVVFAVTDLGDVTGVVLKGGKPVLVCTYDGFADPITGCLTLNGCGSSGTSCP